MYIYYYMYIELLLMIIIFIYNDNFLIINYTIYYMIKQIIFYIQIIINLKF